MHLPGHNKDEHQAAPPLAAFIPPLGPQPNNPKFYSSTETVLALKNKVFSLSGDDFSIRTAEGVDIAKCKGKTFSIRDKKKFTDMQGEEIFTLSNRLATLHKSFYAESPNGHDFEISGKFKLGGSKSVVTFKNASDSRELEMTILGDWLDRKAEIKLNDRTVALVRRKFFNVRDFFGDDTYYVAVAPHVDLTFIAAICIALDEREND